MSTELTCEHTPLLFTVTHRLCGAPRYWACSRKCVAAYMKQTTPCRDTACRLVGAAEEAGQ